MKTTAAAHRLAEPRPVWAAAVRGAGRGVAYGCLDWSERRDHLAGPLAAALLTQCLAQGWLQRPAGDRALLLTPPGRQALGPWLRLDESA